MKVDLPAKKKPLIITYNVDKKLSEKQITEGIRNQNAEGLSREQISEGFKLKFKTGDRKKDTVNWVADVTPETRK